MEKQLSEYGFYRYEDLDNNLSFFYKNADHTEASESHHNFKVIKNNTKGEFTYNGGVIKSIHDEFTG